MAELKERYGVGGTRSANQLLPRPMTGGHSYDPTYVKPQKTSLSPLGKGVTHQ